VRQYVWGSHRRAYLPTDVVVLSSARRVIAEQGDEQGRHE